MTADYQNGKFTFIVNLFCLLIKINDFYRPNPKSLPNPYKS